MGKRSFLLPNMTLRVKIADFLPYLAVRAVVVILVGTFQLDCVTELENSLLQAHSYIPVSYTHLDVYKRQDPLLYIEYVSVFKKAGSK